MKKIIFLLARIYMKIQNSIMNKLSEKFRTLQTNEQRFTLIYKKNHWGSIESYSGTGSTLEYTENLRKELPILIKNYSITSIFDAPCGDFNWMRYLLCNIEISYIGGDIVKPLISDLIKKYKTQNIDFINFNLVEQIPPNVDLMICRDCLFHLSDQDIRATLENFVQSGTKYLLTTSHENIEKKFINRNIITGDFRLIDIFSEPYNFPKNPLSTIQDWIPPFPKRQMHLFSRDQIIEALR